MKFLIIALIALLQQTKATNTGISIPNTRRYHGETPHDQVQTASLLQRVPLLLKLAQCLYLPYHTPKPRYFPNTFKIRGIEIGSQTEDGIICLFYDVVFILKSEQRCNGAKVSSSAINIDLSTLVSTVGSKNVPPMLCLFPPH